MGRQGQCTGRCKGLLETRLSTAASKCTIAVPIACTIPVPIASFCLALGRRRDVDALARQARLHDMIKSQTRSFLTTKIRNRAYAEISPSVAFLAQATPFEAIVRSTVAALAHERHMRHGTAVQGHVGRAQDGSMLSCGRITASAC